MVELVPDQPDNDEEAPQTAISAAEEIAPRRLVD